MITFTNDFHNTRVRLRASLGDYLSDSQIKRAARVLCGISDCACGHGELKTRGRQDDGCVIEFGRVCRLNK